MMWRTHVMGGVAALWLLAPLPQFAMPDTMTLACLAAGLGALLPDLDANNSKIRHLGGSGIYPFAPVAEHMNREYHHRGALHFAGGRIDLWRGCVCFGIQRVRFACVCPVAWLCQPSGFGRLHGVGHSVCAISKAAVSFAEAPARGDEFTL